METIQCITTRRSVRKFHAQAPEKSIVEQIISAAACAPSWKNTQIARYIAITDTEMKQKLADTCMLDFKFNQDTAKAAPMVVAMTIVEKRSGYERDGSFSTSQGTHWQSFDAGIAAQTFCLAAHDLGLGTVIMGVFDTEKVGTLLSIPEGQTCAALIALGYPAETPQMPKRKTVSELVTYQ